MKNFLMSVLWVALFVGLGAMYYYQTTFDARINYMDERAGMIENRYQKFTDQLNDLEVKFVGRAKHVRQNQNDIKVLYSKIEDLKRSHAQDMFLVNTRIDSLGGVVDNNMSNMDSQITALRNLFNSLRATVNQNKITGDQQMQRMDRRIEALEKKVDEIEVRITPQDDKKTKR